MKSKHIIYIILIGSLTLGFVMYQQKSNTNNVGLSVGKNAPEISLKNPDGKVITLSSLKGYVVLIDFWASWCGPCRMENPNIVNAYHNFKSKTTKTAKGFKIYSVSLDKNKSSWTKAIEQDGLVWEEHVSDLKWWYSKAATDYQIESIPSNFLIDENGKILAKNLRGPELQNALSKIFTK